MLQNRPGKEGVNMTGIEECSVEFAKYIQDGIKELQRRAYMEFPEEGPFLLGWMVEKL